MKLRTLMALSLWLSVGSCAGDDTDTGGAGTTAPGTTSGNGAATSVAGNNGATSGSGAAGTATGRSNVAGGSAAAGGRAPSAGRNAGGGSGRGAAANGGNATGGNATGGSGTATAGTGTSTGGNGTTGGSMAPPANVDTSASVLERNKHGSRDAHFVQPALSKAMVAMMAKEAYTANYDGITFASLVYLEQGPANKGAFFVVTTGNDVFAIDETSGSTVWKHNIGSSPTANGVSCGNIHPLGILSTPVIDADARTIFVAGAIGTNSIARHEVHALNVDDGSPRPNWPVDVSQLKSGSLQFNSPPQNQRSALSIVNGIVYVAYGGHVGDCGDYHGWVVGIDSKDPSKRGGWATLGRGEAIWASGGMASDGASVFAVTGNNTGGASTRDASDSEQVVRISGLGQFDRNDKNLYFPNSWRSMDSTDADFGASSPVYFEVPGATPSKFVLAIAKDGHLYLLDSTNLGGMGTPLVDFTVSSGNMSVRTVPAVFVNSKGAHVVFGASGANKCPAGGPSGSVIMSVLIPPGSPPAPKVEWCAAARGENGPIITTTDGINEPVVWYMSDSKLNAVDGETGAALWNSGTGTCTNIRHWTSPIAVKGRIVIAGDGHLCSWSPQ